MLNEQKLASQKSKTMESMILEFTPQQVAHQLSLYNFRLFQNIHPIEFLNKIWLKADDEESLTPSLDFFISRFDLVRVFYWPSTYHLNGSCDFHLYVKLIWS
jgi:hypothetical protein